MARISVVLSGIERKLLNRLAEADAEFTLHDMRLAAGAKILAPADDPSTFVKLSAFQSQLTVATRTLANVTAASSLVSQAKTAVGGIADQLSLIRETLADPDSDLDAAHRAAAQAKIDEAIDKINSLATDPIDGRRVLDGSADFEVSGGNRSQVRQLQVRSARSAPQTISGSVYRAATQAQLVYTGASGKTTAAATFTLTGKRGSATIQVNLQENLDSVATKINAASHETGVVASVDDDELSLTSVDYGTSAMVSMKTTAGTFHVSGGDGNGTANGIDAIARINDVTYDNPVDGNRFIVHENGMDYEIEFQGGFAGQFDTIVVEGGAMQFGLSPRLGHESTLAISNLQGANLGGVSGNLSQIYSGGGYSGLSDNKSRAIRIVDEAIGQLTQVQGQVDGFFDSAITSSSQLLTTIQEELETSIQETDGYDEDEEKTLRAKSQQLIENGQASLSILYEQRMSIVQLIQHIANLY